MRGAGGLAPPPPVAVPMGPPRGSVPPPPLPRAPPGTRRRPPRPPTRSRAQTLARPPAAVQPADVDGLPGIRVRIDVRPANRRAERDPALSRVLAAGGVHRPAGRAAGRPRAEQVAEAVEELGAEADELHRLALRVERPELEARGAAELPVAGAREAEPIALARDELEAEQRTGWNEGARAVDAVHDLGDGHRARATAVAAQLERAGAVGVDRARRAKQHVAGLAAPVHREVERRGRPRTARPESRGRRRPVPGVPAVRGRRDPRR